MAIGVEGNFYFIASVLDKKDFIEEPELDEFTIIEKAGNELPTFYLAFKSNDEQLISIINDGNPINIQMGKDRDNVMDIKLCPVTVNINRVGSSDISFTVTGITYHLGYTNDAKTFITDKKSGLNVIQDYAKQYGFSFESNISSSRDSQNWVQYGITPRQFINDVWLHSYLNNSFIAMGITSDSKIIVKDIKKEIAEKNEKPDWRLVKNKKEGNVNDITYTNNYAIVNNSGLVNSWLGNGRERLVYDLNSGSQKKISVKTNPLMALSNETILNPNMGKKFNGPSVMNGSTHDKYWEAYQNNLTNLALLSSFRVTVPCDILFFPVKVLDLVIFKDVSANNALESNEYLSGMYIVSKVIRTVKDRNLFTYIDICRESPNGVTNVG